MVTDLCVIADSGKVSSVINHHLSILWEPTYGEIVGREAPHYLAQPVPLYADTQFYGQFHGASVGSTRESSA